MRSPRAIHDYLRDDSRRGHVNVVVYGANGWTGVLTANAIERAGMTVILAGRNGEKLAAASAKMKSRPEVRVAPLEDLSSVLAGADAVVNCAGPYIKSGPPLIDAAIAAGVHYLDASGERTYVRDMFARSERARARGVTIAPAMGPKGAFGDWAAAVLAKQLGGAIDEVAIAYALGVREYFQPTPTSVMAIAAQGLFKTKDDYDPARPVSRRFVFPSPFAAGTALLAPTTDDITIPRHVPVSVVRTYVALAPGEPANDVWARFCETYIQQTPAFSKMLWSNPALIRATFREPYQGMTGDSFAVVAEVTQRNRASRIGITLRDAYGITPDVLVLGLLRLADAPRGVVAPSELCDPQRTLKSLVGAGLIRAQRWDDP